MSSDGDRPPSLILEMFTAPAQQRTKMAWNFAIFQGKGSLGFAFASKLCLRHCYQEFCRLIGRCDWSEAHQICAHISPVYLVVCNSTMLLSVCGCGPTICICLDQPVHMSIPPISTRCVSTLEEAHARPIHCIVQPTGGAFVSHPREVYELFATAATDGVAKLWDLRSGRCVRSFAGE